MDTKTMNLKFGEDEVEHMRKIMEHMGEFIANFAVIEKRMTEMQETFEDRVRQSQTNIETQLLEIREANEELRSVMTETGAAHWRVAAEEALKEGEQHIKSLDKISKDHLKTLEINNDEFKKLAKKSFDRLDRAATYTIKNISEAVSSFRISDFQKLTENSCETVVSTSQNAVNRLRDMVKWFHWKNLGLAFVITIFVSLTMGLYLNDEMPWEVHKEVVMQRNAGQALINAWPHLSANEQSRIIENSKKAII